MKETLTCLSEPVTTTCFYRNQADLSYQTTDKPLSICAEYVNRFLGCMPRNIQIEASKEKRVGWRKMEAEVHTYTSKVTGEVITTVHLYYKGNFITTHTKLTEYLLNTGLVNPVLPSDFRQVFWFTIKGIK